jgi:hypothetical protein
MRPQYSECGKDLTLGWSSSPVRLYGMTAAFPRCAPSRGFALQSRGDASDLRRSKMSNRAELVRAETLGRCPGLGPLDRPTYSQYRGRLLFGLAARVPGSPAPDCPRPHTRPAPRETTCSAGDPSPQQTASSDPPRRRPVHGPVARGSRSAGHSGPPDVPLPARFTYERHPR